MRNNPRLSYAVIIPKRNVKNLMLKEDVLKAVKVKKFAIYAVESIDEGIEILTGVKAGKVNDLVTKRVRELSLKVKEFYKSTDSEKN